VVLHRMVAKVAAPETPISLEMTNGLNIIRMGLRA
jgi:hypothetical protein